MKKKTGFIYRLGECWIGPQRWIVEFCDGAVEAGFSKRLHGGAPKEMGKTLWMGKNNIIRINAVLLEMEHPEEILNTIIHEFLHVALEGKWARTRVEMSEGLVEEIAESVDAFLGQALITMGLVSLDVFKSAKEAYHAFLRGGRKALEKSREK